MVKCRLLISVATMLLASPLLRNAHAHPFDMVIINVSLDSSDGTDLRGRGTISLSSRTKTEDDDGQGQKQHPDLVVSDIIGELSVESPSRGCSISVDNRDVVADQREHSFSVLCPDGATAQELRIIRHPERLAGAPDGLTTIYFISLKSQRYTVTLNRGESEKRITFNDTSINLDLLHRGIEHIGAAKKEWLVNSALSIPEGIDHILFVLTLVLASSSLLSLVKNVTGFTLGHSISMAIATLFKTTVHPSVIEPAIAASIALMALDAMRKIPRKRAWIPASLFGLLHGCGFASALLELNLKGSALALGLLLFNLGVEIGQLIFVLIFLVLVSLATKLVGARRPITLFISSAVVLVATWWFIERISTGS